MNDELRAAAMDIIGKWEAKAGDSPVAELVRNAMKLAEGFINEHPADDAEPITEEWLSSIGFSKRGMFAMDIKVPSKTCTFALSCADYENLPCCWELWNEFDDSTPSEGACLPCQPQNRGDVRRLADALGIPLTEPTGGA